MADAPRRSRGRPPKGADGKQPVSFRLSPDVIAALKASGRTRDDTIRAGLIAIGALAPVADE